MKASDACCHALRKTAQVATMPFTRPFEKIGEYLKSREPPELKTPENIVLATAKKPGWLTKDNLVFELKAGDLLEDGEDLEKKGSFFSEKKRAIGQWRMVGNVLYISWPLTQSPPETVVAVKTARHWINEQTLLEVRIVQPAPENPWWFQPEVITHQFQAESVSSREFECPVCYFELSAFPTAVIKRYSRRVCGHYFHKECAKNLLREMRKDKHGATCPICCRQFNDLETMPDLLSDPRRWFAVCDIDFGGELSQFEVIEALGAVLPVNRAKLEKNVRAHWHEWDPDGNGGIDLQEFVIKDTGMRDWVLNHLDVLQSAGPEAKRETAVSRVIPSIDQSPHLWFEYWDANHSGTLERDELVRSLIRTFCTDSQGNPSLEGAFELREAAHCIWKSLGYTAFASVTFDEFVKPYGLMDQFLHNQTSFLYFGEDDELTI